MEHSHSSAENAMGFWRDGSGRLTFDLPGVQATDYPAVCRGIADALGLTPAGEFVIGPDQMFWDFRRGDQVVGLDWDVWMDFMIVAQSVESESLVQEIAAWLSSSRPPKATETATPSAAPNPNHM
jgi:hypothetical protein